MKMSRAIIAVTVLMLLAVPSAAANRTVPNLNCSANWPDAVPVVNKAKHAKAKVRKKRWKPGLAGGAMVGTPVTCSYDPTTDLFDPPGCGAYFPLPPFPLPPGSH